jgi:hypothetical protein
MEHFKPHEFNCGCGHCGLGFDDMDPEFLRMLDDTREYAGVAMIIKPPRGSAIRCDAHNLKVGGSETSSHLTGHAVDVECNTSVKRDRIIRGALQAGFTRIGIAKTFIHLDNDPSKDSHVIWVYK